MKGIFHLKQPLITINYEWSSPLLPQYPLLYTSQSPAPKQKAMSWIIASDNIQIIRAT